MYSRKLNPADWSPSYLNTYIERDVRQLKNIGNLNQFMKLLRLCAGRTGQVLNMTSLSNDCGIDQKTVAAWLAVLQSSFVIYLLRPYHNNFNKRIIKAPKLYFYDTGVACSLLGVEKSKQINTHALKGSLFENFIVAELLKQRLNKGLQDNLYYWRDKTGNEIDLLTDEAGKLTAMEFKSGETISSDYFKGLNYFASFNKKSKQLLVYSGQQQQKRSNGVTVLPWKGII